MKNFLRLFIFLGFYTALQAQQSNEYASRGAEFLTKGELMEARRAYTEAIKLDENNMRLWFKRAEINTDLKYYDLAVYDLDKIIEHDSLNAQAYNLRANAKAKNNDFKSALADYNTAISLEDNYSTAYYGRGYVRYFLRQETGLAIEDLDEAIRLTENIGDYYNVRGLLKMQQENLKSAYQDFTQAIKLEPNREELYTNRGVCNHNGGRYSAAVKDFSQSITLLESGGKLAREALAERAQELYLLRGSAFAAMNKLNEACQDFTVAQQKGNKRAANYLRRFCN